MKVEALKTEYNSEIHKPFFDKIDASYGVDFVIKQIVLEEWTLYNVQIKDTIIGILVVRVDTLVNEEREFIIAYAVSLLQQKIPFHILVDSLFDDLAIQSKCKTIRVYSNNTALSKLIERHTEYKYCETIYIKTL